MTKKQDGLDLLSCATGLTREDMLALRDTAKANVALLNACARHAFAPIEQGKLFPRHRCANCGGEVDAHAAHWYARGISHAGAK